MAVNVTEAFRHDTQSNRNKQNCAYLSFSVVRLFAPKSSLICFKRFVGGPLDIVVLTGKKVQLMLETA